MVLRIRATHLLLAGGFLLAGSPAFAQEGVLFQNLMKGVFGGGEGQDIEYRQRPPLVVPPNSTLPRPQDPASARTAAWPNDPDVARRREEKAATRVPTFNPNWRNNPMLSQEELRKGRIARGEEAPQVAADHNNYNNQIQPIVVGRQLAARHNQADVDALQYGAEPQRRLLTEPPTGYRRPASTAALGPGARGPVEDKQAVGQREFVTGIKPVQ
ncbi:MAG: hypothetical protein DI527_03210 [Chelatococcus sp.]|nr:MAG: hypothetical protein DI527_03210 [Chelatococcus sp.]